VQKGRNGNDKWPTFEKQRPRGRSHKHFVPKSRKGGEERGAVYFKVGKWKERNRIYEGGKEGGLSQNCHPGSQKVHYRKKWS